MSLTARRAPAFLAGVLLVLGASLPVRGAPSEVFIRLAGSSEDSRLRLGLPPFIADSAAREDSLTAKKVRDIIRDDLLFSRYFDTLEEGPHFNGNNLKDIMKDWRRLGASWLLTGKAAVVKDRLSVTLRLINLQSGETAFERYYRQESRHLRSAAHRAADDIVRAATGKMGIAQTRIVFSNNRSGDKEIYLIDYDGENLRQLTQDRSISILPRISFDRMKIAYTGYRDGNPDMFLIDLQNGTNKAISHEQGLNIAGGFSPDGSQILMTLSRQKNPNIYLKNLIDGTVTRLTRHWGVDTSPTFSPDASQVAFVSNRSGKPQIFVLDMTTNRAKRLTRLNWCDSPSWSPTGEWIAFAGRAGPRDRIDIYLVDVTGTQLRRLTHSEGSNEDPSWSPDGRFISFTSSRSGKPELYMMDADGSVPHRIALIPGKSFTPNWSN